MNDAEIPGMVPNKPSLSTPSPDALLFEALIRAAPQQPCDELADLVLRLAGAVRQTTVALREASACLAEEQGGPRLPQLLARAEAASLEQADCTTALICHLAPKLAAA